MKFYDENDINMNKIFLFSKAAFEGCGVNQKPGNLDCRLR